MKKKWQPILGNELQGRALEATKEIAAELAGLNLPDQDASLAGGSAGIALLYGYLALTHSKPAYEEKTVQFLEAATNSLESEPMSASLYGGFSGIAWACIHLQKRLEMDTGDFTEIDRALNRSVSISPWRGDYDLIVGLVGLGVYALERLPHPAARQCLKKVIDRLGEIAEENADGITWFTSPDLLPKWQRDLCPRGYYNLGLAHGVPGVIALLAHTYSAGIQRRKTKRLLQGAVKWILQNKLTKDEGSYFSAWAGSGVEQTPCRSAWCYGDPGIAAALLCAARLVGERTWEEEAMKIMLHAAQRPPDEAGVKDAGLCHGSAGLGHIFNRVFQATGHPKFKKAAQFWFQRTLELRTPGKGIAGYQVHWPEQDGTVAWKADPGILTGAAGIALALLAAVTPVEPEWDRMLLVDIRHEARIK